MGVFFRVLIGLVIAAAGFTLVWRTRKWYEMFGSIPWAEEKFGGGGTELFYKILGIGMAFLGIFIATNIASDIINSLLGFLYPSRR